MDQRQLQAYGALLAAQALLATLTVAGRVGVQALHFLPFALVRSTGGALILAALVLLLGRQPVPDRADLKRIAGYAVFGILINQTTLLWGLTHTTATNAALIITTIPVITYALAILMGHERFQWLRGAGIAVALAGVLVLLDPREADLTGTWFGNLLVFVNTISSGLYFTLSRPVLSRVAPLTMTAWLFGFGALMVAPLALAYTATHPGTWQLSTGTWLLLGYVVLGPTVAKYALNLYGLSKVASSTVAAFMYLQPILAATLAWALLGESITAVHVLTGALVLLGLTLVSVGRERPRIDVD